MLNLQTGPARPLDLTATLPSADLVFRSAPAAYLALNQPTTAPGLDLSSNPASFPLATSGGKSSKTTMAVAAVVTVVMLGGIGYIGTQFALKTFATQKIEALGYTADDNGLYKAISNGASELIPEYDRLGINVSSSPRLIEAALRSGSPDVLSMVIRGGARLDPNADANHLLALGIDSDNANVLQLLFGIAPIQSNQVVGAVKYAIETQRINSLVRLAMEPVVQDFRSDNGETISHVAAVANSKQLIDQLQSIGKLNVAVLNANGETPLHYAASFSKAEAVSALIALGGNPLTTNNAGESALSLAWKAHDDSLISSIVKGSKPATEALVTNDISAVFSGHLIATAEALIDQGFAINTPLPSGLTPLSFSIQAGDLEMAKALLSKGADIESISSIQSVSGVTALHMAVAYENLDAVRMLLASGANKAAAASNGATPRSLAASRRNVAILGLLDP